MINVADLKVKIIVTQFRASYGNKVNIVQNVLTCLEKDKDMIYIGHFHIGTHRSFIQRDSITTVSRSCSLLHITHVYVVFLKHDEQALSSRHL